MSSIPTCARGNHLDDASGKPKQNKEADPVHRLSVLRVAATAIAAFILKSFPMTAASSSHRRAPLCSVSDQLGSNVE